MYILCPFDINRFENGANLITRIFVFSGRKVTIAGSPEPVKSGSHRSGKFTSNKKKQASVRVDEAGNKTKIKVRTCIYLIYKHIFGILHELEFY